MLRNLVGGQWREVSRSTLPVYNPATGEVIEEVPLSGPEEVGRRWRRPPGPSRAGAGPR
jgi:malonate-semialdehyde dehydrogenase (acetylating)/methylmalonate-semialdehyde dehydrogenase